MLDIHAFSRLVSRAPQHLKLRTYFFAEPLMNQLSIPQKSIAKRLSVDQKTIHDHMLWAWRRK